MVMPISSTQLAPQRLLDRFAGLDLAARELPVARVHLARRARGEQEGAVGADQHAHGDLDFRAVGPAFAGRRSACATSGVAGGRSCRVRGPRSRARTGRPRGRCASRAPAPRPAPRAAPPRWRLRVTPNQRQPLRRDRQVLVLAERVEAHPQAEALGQRDLLLHHLARMHLAVLGVRVARGSPSCTRAAGGAGCWWRRSARWAWPRRPSRRGSTSAPCSRARPPRSSGRRRRR